MNALNTRRIRLFFVIAAVLIIANSQSYRAVANPGPFQKGDVFVTVNKRFVQHYDPSGNLLETFDTGGNTAASVGSCAFDSVGNLYVSTFLDHTVIRFAGPNDPHTNLGTFGSGLPNNIPPHYISFDALGNVYVSLGVENYLHLYKFDRSGNFLAEFNGEQISGYTSFNFDLAADQKTIFYTSTEKRILRYDIESNSQLSDFSSSLPGSRAYALRLLPDGSVLVADTEFILHLDSTGNEIKRYDAPAQDLWTSLSLDPDGKSFWSADYLTGKFFKFDIATGNQLFVKDTGGKEIGDLCVFKEPRVSTQDTDGDGLLDYWETHGIPGADLPNMGADPNKKDVYVQVDWMEGEGHNQKPSDRAINLIVDAFANSGVDGKGINLHVDLGPDSIDRVTGHLWGDNGKGHKISFKDTLGKDIELHDDIVNNSIHDGLPRQFDRVFHYALFVYKFLEPSDHSTGHSGKSLDGTQIFLVSLANWTDGKGSIKEQAGTFMHELGHNLGLGHGGPFALACPVNQCNIDHKPNYLSVMNYSFQEGGLVKIGLGGAIDGYFDYSRFAANSLPNLKEDMLVESSGIGGADGYGTKHHADKPNVACVGLIEGYLYFKGWVIDRDPHNIDWNCNGPIETSPIQFNITGTDGDTEELRSYEDWHNLVFKQGHIGLGGVLDPIMVTAANVASSALELTIEQDLQIQRISEPRVQLIQTVFPNGVPPNGTVTFSIMMHNTDAGDANEVNIIDTLPAGFSYQPGSTSGATTVDPVINGQNLTWGPFTVPANGGTLALTFRVAVPNSTGAGSNTISGNSTNGIVLPIGDAAQVIVGSSLYFPMLLQNSKPSILPTATPVAPTATSTSIINNIFTPTFTPVPPTATNTLIPPTVTPAPPTPTFTPISNTPPVANNQNVTTAQNTAKSLTLTASDANNDPLIYSIVSNPTHGALSGTLPNLSYTPNAGFSGADSFTFRVNDGKADSNIAIVSIMVTSPTLSSISGRVVDSSNNLLSGITIYANGPTAQSIPATTDNGGNYTFTDLESGYYILTPIRGGYTFSPYARAGTIPPSATNTNFTGTLLQLDIAVTDVQTPASPICAGSAGDFYAYISYNSSADSGFFDIQWQIDGQSPDVTQTRNSQPGTGEYKHTFQRIPLGQHTFTVVADATNLVTEINEGNNQGTKTFTAVDCSLYSVSGQVKDANTNLISNVTLSDGAGHTVTTDANGNYTLSGLAVGTYTLTPSKSSYTFSPASRTIIVPPNATGMNFTGTPPTATTITIPVIQGGDDAGIHYLCDYSTNVNEIYFGHCDAGNSITSGFRFQNVKIPAGATINEAHLEFTVDGPYTNEIAVQLFGQQSANVATFTDSDHPDNRPLTTTFVPWTVSAADPWPSLQSRSSPNLSAVIQEIVNLPGWTSGNALAIIVKAAPAVSSNANRRVFAWEREQNSNHTARLVVNYTPK